MLNKSMKAVIFFAVVGWSLAGMAEVPAWLRTLARQTPKTYADDANAVALLDEKETSVNDKGEIVTHRRVAFRILRPEGRDYATYEIVFSNETKVNFLRGWSITSKGQEYEAKDKDAFERSISTYEVYSDDKEKILHVPGDDVGTVVGFEFERKNRPYVFDDTWVFQKSIPVERSRYTLRLPSSWEMKTHWVNHAELQPSSQNGTYVWEIADVPRIEQEYNQPPQGALAGRMIVAFFSEKFKSQTYKNWSELAAWEDQLSTSSFDTSTALQQKVQELAPATLPLLDRIKTLARFAQKDIRYAAIEIGIGGFKPHPASEIFM